MRLLCAAALVVVLAGCASTERPVAVEPSPSVEPSPTVEPVETPLAAYAELRSDEDPVITRLVRVGPDGPEELPLAGLRERGALGPLRGEEGVAASLRPGSIAPDGGRVALVATQGLVVIEADGSLRRIPVRRPLLERLDLRWVSPDALVLPPPLDGSRPATFVDLVHGERGWTASAYDGPLPPVPTTGGDGCAALLGLGPAPAVASCAGG